MEEELKPETRLRELAHSIEAPLELSYGQGKIRGAIFEKVAETQLIQPTFIYDYPTELSPLSKTKPGDPETVERFEL